MELSPQHPPTIIEGLAPNVVDPNANGSVKTWQLATQFNKWQNTNRPNVTSSSRQPGLTKNWNVGRYYQMLINGTNNTAPIPLDDMLGESKIEVFVNATQKVYGMYMAQVFSDMKQNLTSPTVVPAYMEAKVQWRVRQNNSSKIALQVLLGIMVVCGGLAWLCMNTKEVLPHNPCTIAGIASLFVDSGLWDEGVEKEGLGHDLHAVESLGDCVVSVGWHDKVVVDGEDDEEENVPGRWFGIDRVSQQQHD